LHVGLGNADGAIRLTRTLSIYRLKILTNSSTIYPRYQAELGNEVQGEFVQVGTFILVTFILVTWIDQKA
jgi:hypothetical protein